VGSRKKTGGRVAVPETLKQEVGERIRRLRTGLSAEPSQDLAAEKGGLDRTAYLRLEQGTNTSSAANVRGLARAFGTTMDLMFDYLEGRASLADVLPVAESSWSSWMSERASQRLAAKSGAVTEREIAAFTTAKERPAKIAPSIVRSVDDLPSAPKSRVRR
jgi:transcriptional regulator with XRE-family HTH domain